MRWRYLPALTLALLGLLLASPLSNGDKGLWLSLHGPHEALLRLAYGTTPTEHSTLLPDRQGRVVANARAERPDSFRSLGAVPDDWATGVAGVWRTIAPLRTLTPGLPVGERPSPRAPPA